MMSLSMDSLSDIADLILERIAILHPIQAPLSTLSQAGHTNSSWTRTEKQKNACLITKDLIFGSDKVN